VKFYWKPGEPLHPGDPLPLAWTDAILWAHKVEAGFACVGFSRVRRGEKEGQLQLPDVTVIHPGFINPNVTPELPGFCSLPGSPFYVNPNVELELVQSPNGAYVILQPIQWADGHGLLTDPTRAKMIFADPTARQKMVDKYAGQRKSLTVGRTIAGFVNSKLYRVRSGSLTPALTSYFYPVLIELGA
jgi:hypothetical protein